MKTLSTCVAAIALIVSTSTLIGCGDTENEPIGTGEQLQNDNGEEVSTPESKPQKEAEVGGWESSDSRPAGDKADRPTGAISNRPQ